MTKWENRLKNKLEHEVPKELKQNVFSSIRSESRMPLLVPSIVAAIFMVVVLIGIYQTGSYQNEFDQQSVAAVISQEDLIDNHELLAKGLVASELNYPDGKRIDDETAARVKIRYKHPGQTAKLFPQSDGRCRIIFDEPVRAITPGQAVVAYEGDRVICGGWIEKAIQ